MKSHLKRLPYVVAFVIFWSLFMSPVGSMAKPEEQAPGRKLARKATMGKKVWITTDHTKHEVLKQAFQSGDEVTRACLSCHSEAVEQFHQTIHWTWIDPNSGKDVLVGKAGHSINNFCISTNKMKDKKCLGCHTGWNGKNGEVNCLVCHGQKDFNFREAFEDFQAFSAADDAESREMAEEIQHDIQQAVQSIGRPTRRNCGSCHFYGGGGDGVKHGDLDSSMIKPNKALDVHMGYDGQQFQCVRCHTTTRHNVAGRIYSTPASMHRKSLIEDDLTPKIMCESCHSSTPHKPGSKSNDHTDKVACQSCHIPQFARVNPTKMWWDWSKSGKKKDGKPYKVKGPLGKMSYMSIKGEMKWAKNVTPQYFWFNGSINTLTAKDMVDPGKPVRVSWPVGSRDDKNSRIFPFKIHRGKQPYDKVHKTLLTPVLSGKNGYWKTLDWSSALTKGAELIDLPFSGKFGFVETSYVFPITHMVAPKEEALACTACHRRQGSRLANLSGFYMPGRDFHNMVDLGGWILFFGSLAGVVLHGLGRVFSKNGREG